MENPDRQKALDNEADLQNFLNKLNGLPAHERGERALLMAARLVEYGAFELAGHVNSDTVGEMVNLSARLSGRGQSAPGSPPESEVVQLFPLNR
ncbi:hypothetical protein [uncultured Roseobacter sp.]|uniref:hypothetical protein n=1 Tax=uncultured Roseobacter sp. TaxID=114847 RepID=UPI002634BBB9|nr:hypothetical protein [uncultured Roseobacter sp.]